ncbi:acetate--CoA ligase family protein [Xenophilus arseniciresistens]|uniref:Acetate--CoA ligase family protein n=1 Tax=Xenophilus arseniciresistens TaxID=1283306 RepID=A0AAE3N7L2_9BURK|nr:acetate--CoA ligase family protein [Xenophilus arseniciresistens]MDA7416053.1 acetate--CoA ligase family protein [Xenophilus arseniciresistens]
MTAVALKTLLNPRSVAVIGASEDQTKFGGRLYKTLLQHQYAGEVYPINPSRDSLFGLKTFASIQATPQAPDMVIMALPRDKVKAEIAACAERGARAGIIITSKFSDAGPEGQALEREVVEAAARHGMRLIGPNCLGLISPANKLVLCSSPALNVPSLIEAPIGFVSQSGALMGTLFDRSYGLGIGFSHCVSVGNQADLELCDFVEFLIEDDRTQVICSYVEGIKSPQRFMALARRARLAGKPWLMVKAGATADGSRAAYSHTASLAGDFAALKAICDRENIVMMDDPLDMLSLARAMVRYPARRVSSVAVITTSGGGGAISADQLSHAGIGLAQLGAATRAGLAEHYSEGQANNPIDIGGRRHEGSTDELGQVTAELVLADPATDLGLMVLTTAPDVPGLTRQLAEGAQRPAAAGKPTLYVMLPGRVAAPAREMLVAGGLPYVDTLAEAMAILRGWKAWSTYQAPEAPSRPAGMAAVPAPAGGTLGEAAAKALLAGVGIPVNQERIVRTADQAVDAAGALGFPLVLKVVSPDIAHKSDVGGVALNIDSAQALRHQLALMQSRVAQAAPDARIEGYSLQKQEHGELELIVGARRDPQFGAQVVVGAGGVLVELLKDVAILGAPVDPASARRAVEGLKVAPLLKPYRGRGALDIEAVVDAIVRLSWLAHDLESQGLDFEVEVNPLKLRLQGQGAVAVDARARIGAR